MKTVETLASEALVNDAWLTQVCGWPCFRATEALAAAGPELIARSLVAAAEARAFFYAKRPSGDVASCARLTRAGFVAIDCAVTLQWDEHFQLPPVPVEITVTAAQARQHGDIQDIAENCFRFSRFHADPLFPKLTANAIKRAWITNYCLGNRGDALYAAEVDGRTVGFLAVLTSVQGGRLTAVIDLVGVAPDFQGRRVGQALVSTFVTQWRTRAETLTVGTQVANIPSLRFYESCGFRVVDTNWVLHAHVREGALIQC